MQRLEWGWNGRCMGAAMAEGPPKRFQMASYMFRLMDGFRDRGRQWDEAKEALQNVRMVSTTQDAGWAPA